MKRKYEYILPFERWEFCNGDLFPLLKRLAEQKAKKVDEVVTSPKADKWLKKIALFFILALGSLVSIHLVMLALR